MEVVKLSILVVKIGGSVITNKRKKFSINEQIIDRISEELAETKENFILVHGGGSFGHPLAEKYNISSGYQSKDQLMGFAKTHQAMEELNSKLVNSLLKVGVPVFPVQTSACTIVKNGEITHLETKNIEKLLELGIMPILYGDCIPDLKKGMTILSGDQLVAFIARKLNVKRVIFGTDIDGVFTMDPKKNKEAEIISEITPEKWKEISASVNFASTGDVTGGMKNKVEVLINLAKDGIKSQIINAKKPGILKKAIRSDIEAGTIITKGDAAE